MRILRLTAQDDKTLSKSLNVFHERSEEARGFSPTVRHGVVTNDAERDVALLDRLARTGDARAFEILYHRHTQALYATAIRIVRDEDDAADVVHDTWVRAVESLHRFENRSAL